MKKSYILKLTVCGILSVFGFLWLINQISGNHETSVDLTVKEVFERKEVRKLASAAAHGETNTIDKLLREEVSVNHKGKYGITPLYWAMVSKNHEGFSYLLEQGADPNVPIHGLRKNIIEWAVSHPDSRFLKQALQHGGNPNLNTRQEHPLVTAALTKQFKNMKHLIKGGANVNYRYNTGSTPVLQAAYMLNNKAVYILLKNGAHPTRFDDTGSNLKKVFEKQNSDKYTDKSLRILRKNNIPITWTANRIFKQHELKELGSAIKNSDVQRVKSLNDKETLDINSSGKHGITPLWWAAAWDRYKIFSYLLKQGANPNAKIKSDWRNIMEWAAMLEDSRFLEKALEYGGDANLITKNEEETPIFTAIRAEQRTNVRRLIEAGADLNHQSETGETPARLAVRARNYKTALLILEQGGDPTLLGNIRMLIIPTDKDNPYAQKILQMMPKDQ